MHSKRITFSEGEVFTKKGEYVMKKLSGTKLLVLVLGIFLTSAISYFSGSLVLTIIASIVFSAIVIALLSGGKDESKAVEHIKSIGSNEFLVKKKSLDREDELEREVSKVFEELRNNFKSQVAISTNIMKTAGDIAGISVEAKSRFEVISELTSKANEKSTEQCQMLSEVSNKTDNIVGSIRNLKELTDDTAEFTEKSISSATAVIRETDKVREKIQNTKELVTNTSEKVEELRRYSEEIVSMVELINNISEQTNMLALNASIEAARAGEHGRGFAVVASEVGKLAGETSQVSKGITKVLDTLKQDIGHISKDMELEVAYVEEEYQSMNNAIEEFNKIQEGLQMIVDKVVGMKDNMFNVSAESESIKDDVLEVTSFSNEISASMDEAESEVTSLDRRIEELERTSHHLNTASEEMQQFVAGKAMDDMMLEDIKHILEKYPSFKESDVEKAIREIKSDDLMITDESGTAKIVSDKSSAGINLYEVEPNFRPLKEGAKKYVSTPVKRRAEDGSIFKYLAYKEGPILYQVGISIDSLLKA